MAATRRVTFVTCASDVEELARCRASIEALRPGGFETSIEEIDNRANRHSAPEALNLGWSRADGDLVVFCHDDVTFPPGWLESLRRAIGEVEAFHPDWAVLGPVGRTGKRYLGRASGPDGVETHHGPLPARVETLDELCLVVPRGLPFRFDEALGGFHLYGVDLCIQAAEAGRGCYAVDAPCCHHSLTRHRPPDYHAVKRRLQRKWRFRRQVVGRSVGTTCGRIRFGLFEGWI